MIYVFVDGAASPKKIINPADSGFESASSVILEDNYTRYELAFYHPNETISYAELFAMKKAIEMGVDYAKKFDEEIYIVSDSEYVVKSMNKWIYKWAKKKWTKSDDTEVAYRDIMEDLYNNYLNRKIKYDKLHIIHINGHISDKNLRTARYRFMDDNKFDITDEEFAILAKGNNDADKLAVKSKEDRKNYEFMTIKRGNLIAYGKKEKET